MIDLSFITVISISRKGCIGNISTGLLWKEKFAFSAYQEDNLLQSFTCICGAHFQMNKNDM